MLTSNAGSLPANARMQPWFLIPTVAHTALQRLTFEPQCEHEIPMQNSVLSQKTWNRDVVDWTSTRSFRVCESRCRRNNQPAQLQDIEIQSSLRDLGTPTTFGVSVPPEPILHDLRSLLLAAEAGVHEGVALDVVESLLKS